MKRIITILPILVCLAGAWIIVAAVMEHREKKKEDVLVVEIEPLPAVAPDADTYSAQDRELVRQVFDEPETLDAERASLPHNWKRVVTDLAQEATKANHGNTDRPALMSAQFQGTENETIEAGSEQVQSPPSMVESFASLRTDAVRNPDSEQNQAAVKSIMQKRQNRIAELERK